MPGFFSSLFRGIGRAFTVPAKVRKQLDANQAVQALKPQLVGGILAGAFGAIDKDIKEPIANAVVRAAVQHAIENALDVKPTPEVQNGS